MNDSYNDYKDLLRELEDRGMLDMADASSMTLSQDGQENFKESLEDALRRGEITPEELAEALRKTPAACLRLPD